MLFGCWLLGCDTTSKAISATLFYLSHDPAALATVTREIRNVFPDLKVIRRGPALTSCTYLLASFSSSARYDPF